MDSHGQEKLSSQESPSQGAGPSENVKKPEQNREVKQKAADILHSDSVDSAEGMDGMESGDGRVSESAGEDKGAGPQAGGKRAYSDDEREAIRAKLLAALPPQEVMIKEIRKKLYKEEKVLTKRMKKLQKKSHTQAFQLTIVVAQLRRVSEYFSILAHATYELVKNLWLKIVHGV
ncbi:MAG: hypothetical protein AAB588_06945 [Patescibacteria group bacterium]